MQVDIKCGEGADIRVPLSLAVQFLLFVSQLKLQSNRCKEGLEVVEKILLAHSAVPVQQVQQLSFHQVDLSQRKAEAIITFHACVSSPMLVLRTRVIQILCSKDE